MHCRRRLSVFVPLKIVVLVSFLAVVNPGQAQDDGGGGSGGGGGGRGVQFASNVLNLVRRGQQEAADRMSLNLSFPNVFRRGDSNQGPIIRNLPGVSLPNFRPPAIPGGPVTRYTQYFSQVPNDTVKLYLYDDASDPTKFREISVQDEDSLNSIKVSENGTLKILIHGFTRSHNASFPQEMKNAFLEYTDNPVICVDWSSMAGDPNSAQFRHVTEPMLYVGIVDRNIPKVGQYVAQVITQLKSKGLVAPAQVHLIGHSLGAHVAGEIGTTVESQTEEKIGRITGLDPAAPHFELKSFQSRLDETDASFVDVVHTSQLLGDRRMIGHADFYPNSDKFPQPGCVSPPQSGVPVVRTMRQYLEAVVGSCDHHRAIDYYTASISNDTWIGCQFVEARGPLRRLRRCNSDDCDNGVIFGEHVSSGARGEFCLNIELEDED